MTLDCWPIVVIVWIAVLVFAVALCKAAARGERK